MPAPALTTEQRALQAEAAQYSFKYLTKAVDIHTNHVWPRHTHQRERYELTRPLYRKAVQYGLVKCQIPQQLGGSGSSAIDAAIVFEETYAADSSVTLSIAATGVGLLPLILGGSSEQQRKFLQPFLVGRDEPVASLVHSEPGGTTGWLSGSKGLQTTARREGDYWIVNGVKEGNLNSAGWDRKGADLSCLTCRITGPAFTDVSASPRESTIILLITRDLIAQQQQQHDQGDRSYASSRGRVRPPWQVISESELSRAAHPAISGPLIRLTNFRVPATAGYALAQGDPARATALVERCLARDAALSASCAVGAMRRAVAVALRTAPPGALPAVLARRLDEARARVLAGRALAWDALQGLEGGADAGAAAEGEEERLGLAHAAVIRARSAAVAVVADLMGLLGPGAVRAESPFARLLVTAASLPLTEGGAWTLQGETAVRAREDLVNGTKALAL